MLLFFYFYICFVNKQIQILLTMKKLILFFLLCLPLISMAKNDNDKTNPKYLKGAITLTDGKVTFSKQFKIPNATQADIYNRMLTWAENRFKPEGKLNSFVAYKNPESGEIAVTGEEYLVFSSTAISLDRTRIYYQLTIEAKDGECNMTMSRIRYWYDEARDGGERYTAEEWITDDMALNKKQTKLAPICGKFRRETINLKDDIFEAAGNELGVNGLAAQTTTITTQTQTTPTVTLNASDELKEVGIGQLPSNLSEIAEQGKITLKANGEELSIKAEDWGGFGKMFNKNIAYILMDQSRIAASALMEQSESYSVQFYTANNTQPNIVIECKKMMSQNMSADEVKTLNQSADTTKTYTMYTGEITKISMR